MTKRREPLSIDAALARIAGQVPGGWAAMALATSYHERTVRGWGDPEREEQINLPAAIVLDIAYQAAGGTGAPILEAYADLVKIAASERFGCKQELQRETMALMRETHEAEIALLEAAQPGAGDAELAIAQKELIEGRNQLDRILSRLASLGRKPP